MIETEATDQLPESPETEQHEVRPATDDAVTGKPSRARTGKKARKGTAAPHDENRFDLNDSAWYLNRELTWLEFNRRVLHEAQDERTPLLERLKFIAIVSANLDEFFMKRIGGLKQQIGAGMHELTLDGRTPRQQVAECHAVIRDINARKSETFSAVRALLEQKGIVIESYDTLTAKEKKQLREQYYDNIYPLLTPQSIDPAHPFPFISNLSLNLLVALRLSPLPGSCPGAGQGADRARDPPFHPGGQGGSLHPAGSCHDEQPGHALSRHGDCRPAKFSG